MPKRKKRYLCPDCKEGFSYELALAEHLYTIHGYNFLKISKVLKNYPLG